MPLDVPFFLRIVSRGLHIQAEYANFLVAKRSAYSCRICKLLGEKLYQHKFTFVVLFMVLSATLFIHLSISLCEVIHLRRLSQHFESSGHRSCHESC